MCVPRPPVNGEKTCRIRFDNLKDAEIALLNRYGEKYVMAFLEDLIEMNRHSIHHFELQEGPS